MLFELAPWTSQDAAQKVRNLLQQGKNLYTICIQLSKSIFVIRNTDINLIQSFFNLVGQKPINLKQEIEGDLSFLYNCFIFCQFNGFIDHFFLFYSNKDLQSIAFNMPF